MHVYLSIAAALGSTLVQGVSHPAPICFPDMMFLLVSVYC